MSKQKKRKRARVQIAVDEQGKPVYKWANGYTKAELEASKTKIRIEYGVDLICTQFSGHRFKIE